MAQDQLRRDIDAAILRGDLAAARDLLDIVIAANPADREARYASARICRGLGDREGAIERYRACLDFDAEDAIAQFGLSVLGAAPPPARVPDDILHYVFDQNAAVYEKSMAEIGYQTPRVLGDMLSGVDIEPDAAALDLGCGTGLNGERIRPRVRKLVGLDLSQPMLDLARQKGIYDRLVCAEMLGWLAGESESYDLVMATNVLMYFGALGPVFAAIRRIMKPGAVLAFDLELLDKPVTEGFILGTHSNAGRYAHTEAYAEASLTAAGLRVRQARHSIMRTELGQPVAGLFMVAQTIPTGRSDTT